MARRRGRPSNAEREITVVSGGQLASIPILGKLAYNMFELSNPDDLLSRKGFKIYRDMLADETVKACLRFKKVLVTGRAYEIVPAGEDEADGEAKKIAEFVARNLEKLNWNRIQRDMLSALDYGFSVGEKIWELGEDEEKGESILLKDIKFRDPEWIKIDVDVHGNIKQFRQLTDLPPNEIVLPTEKVLHFAYQNEFSNHYGISDLRAAYRAWWSKKFIVQFWNIFLERFGQPLMMMKYPQGATSELKDALKRILTGLSSKTDILVPEGVVVELIEATRAGTAQYDNALVYQDVAISRALLVPALLGMGVDIKRGSDSQSRLHLRVLMKIANDVSIDVEEAINDHIVKPLVDMNFDDVKDYPRYTYRDYGEYEAIEIVESMSQLFNAGMLDVDQHDVNYARSVLGLPLRAEGDEDEILRAPPPPVGGSPNDPNAAGAGATGSNKRAQKGVGSKSKRAK